MALKEKWFFLLFIFVVTSAEEGLRCPSTASPNECQEEGSIDDEYYFDIKGIYSKISYGPKYFHLTCPNNVTLESKFLPVFDREMIINHVKLSKCDPPADGYAAALLALNITVRFTLELDSIAEGPALRAKHFDALNITVLIISARSGAFIRSESAFLASPTRLLDLRLTNVSVDTETVLRLPPRLKLLKLKGTGIDRLPAAALARLPDLETLLLSEERLTDVELTTARVLRVVQVTAPVDGLTLAPTVQNVTLINARGTGLRGECAALQNVWVQNAMAPLPGRWLANCSRVQRVQVSGEGAVPAADEWRSAAGLLELDLRHCALRALPTDWLADAFKLQRLDLSYNRLEFLPRELFSANAALQRLDLSHNNLRREAAASLAPLSALRWLSLSGNTLGDLCEVKDALRYNTMSALRPLHALERLELARTGASRVCPDWRTELRRLAHLDLRQNNVSRLEFTDTQWERAPGSRVFVDLGGGAAVRELDYSPADYAAALADTASAALELRADWALHCDCNQYWAARALCERPDHAPALRTARCAAGDLLRERRAENLTCVVPPEECPRGCTCAVSPEHAALSCGGAGLSRLPAAARPPRLPPARTLLAPRNNLTRIAPLDVLHNLTMLDVSDNKISTIDAETTEVLFALPERRVLLAGNPLDCSCAARVLLRAVAERPRVVGDLRRATCADGRALATAAAAADCVRAPLWPAAAALLLLLPAALLALLLARPAARVRIKAFLFGRGLCLRWLLRPADDDDDAARTYDAFVSFSHRDAPFAHELAARLERGGVRRLCLHERDWTPGEWIPAQIAASVRRSRRTLVLLSEHFLSSQWARAELREAYAAALGELRPRLLVVLLPGLEPAAAARTPELRAYLAAVTYLRWDDPRFWDKLLLALPPPRPAPRAPPAPPPLAPPQAPHPTPTAA